MRRYFFYVVLILSFLSHFSCGEGTDATTEKDEKSDQLKGHEEVDLSQWGFQVKIMIPSNGEHAIALTERGALEIIVVPSFGIEIMFGEGDIELLKADLRESLVFTSEIVKEEEDVLIYTQDIPNAGIATKSHFFYKKQIDNDIYEIRDLVDGEYSMELIEKMLIAAKTLKSINSSVVVDQEEEKIP